MIHNLTQLFKYTHGDITKIEGFSKAVNDRSRTQYVVHHRKEITEEKIRSAEDLINSNEYYGVEPEDLIILTKAEHNLLHNTHMKKETKQKKSESMKGKTTNRGCHWKLSKEAIERQNATKKGRHWYTNGVINRFCKECPEGFYKGKTSNPNSANNSKGTV